MRANFGLMIVVGVFISGCADRPPAQPSVWGAFADDPALDSHAVVPSIDDLRPLLGDLSARLGFAMTEWGSHWTVVSWFADPSEDASTWAFQVDAGVGLRSTRADSYVISICGDRTDAEKCRHASVKLPGAHPAIEEWTIAGRHCSVFILGDATAAAPVRAALASK